MRMHTRSSFRFRGGGRAGARGFRHRPRPASEAAEPGDLAARAEEAGVRRLLRPANGRAPRPRHGCAAAAGSSWRRMRSPTRTPTSCSTAAWKADSIAGLRPSPTSSRRHGAPPARRRHHSGASRDRSSSRRRRSRRTSPQPSARHQPRAEPRRGRHHVRRNRKRRRSPRRVRRDALQSQAAARAPTTSAWRRRSGE